MTISIQIAIALGVVMSLSLMLNALLIYYTRTSLSKFTAISAGIIELKDSVGSFVNHLSFVYELEMYYGDETLKGLIDHAKTLSETLERYDEFYDLFEFVDDDEEEEEIEEEAEDGAQTQEG